MFRNSYTVDRLVAASGLASMQIVERIERTTRKREAFVTARRASRANPGSWVQVRDIGGAVLATFTTNYDQTRKV
jgi:hypothetical protein